MAMKERLARALNVRREEGRTLVVMASFLLLNTANTTVLSAAKNGLFLSVYPTDRIPYVVILASLLTAVVAVIFTGYIAGTARRGFAIGLTVAVVASVAACWGLVTADSRSSFVAYLWLSAVQVLLLTHAWDYVSDLLTGRQARRLLPLIGLGASVGAIIGGVGAVPTALGLGTESLLLVSVGLSVLSLPLLWAVPEPASEEGGAEAKVEVPSAFVQRASRGLRAVAGNRLLRLLAVGLIALTLTGTLIDLQLKFLLQAEFSRDRITAIYGLLSASVGAGTLLLQLWASKVLFPRFGVSFAAVTHGLVLTLAAGGVALVGGLYALVAAQAIDDVLQFSLQKPVEQVSLLPFPGRVKSVALATLGGVLRPLSKASGGGVALLLVNTPRLLPVATLVAAATATVTYSRHRSRYLAELESALARQAMEIDGPERVALVADVGALSAIDKALRDEDPTIVVFATALLEQLPAADGVPRILTLLRHEVPEVRAEAARVFSLIEAPLDFAAGMAIAGALASEREPLVITALLGTIGSVGGVQPDTVERFLSHPETEVRRAAVVALGRLGWGETGRTIRALLSSERSSDRCVGAGAVGDLGAVEFIEALAPTLVDAQVRPVALQALSALGPPAVFMLSELLKRRDLPLPVRRSVVSALANVDGSEARDVLVDLLDEPALGPAALTSLHRMRVGDKIGVVEAERVRSTIRAEIQRGLKFAAAAQEIRRNSPGSKERFVADELAGLERRSVDRVLKMLGLSYEAVRVAAGARALQVEDRAQRSNALELLEGTLSRASARAVIPFLEVVTEGLPPHRVDDLLVDASRVRRNPAEALTEEADWWPRALGLHILGRDAEITTPGLSEAARTSLITEEGEQGPMIPLIEKVMILKGSEFFKNFPGADLAGIAARAEVVFVEPGEVIFEQGADGDAFYVVVQGTVRVSRGHHDLATLGSREGFGEMALLDREERSATVTAKERTTLLRLDRDAFDRAIEQNPVVARGIYRVLTERLRNTLAQVAAG